MATSELSRELNGTPYAFVRPLAVGGMGEVAVVEHLALEEKRVLKVLKAEYAQSEELVRRLRTEARMLTRLAHENLVRVLDFGITAKGRPFLVTELLAGQPLSVALKGKRSMPEREALELMRQALTGLEKVHEAEFVHRDVKPDNLFLAEAGGKTVVKILDFGVAKILTPEGRAALGQTKPTDEGLIVGTPTYLSPEQALGKPADARADVYGVAATLYRMLTGAPVFTADSQLEVLQKHVLETPVAPSLVGAQPVSAATDALVLRGLAKKREERFQSAREMREAIEQILSPNVTAAEAPAPIALPKQTTPMAKVPLVEVAAAQPPAQVAADGDSAHGTVAALPSQLVEPRKPAPAPSKHAAVLGLDAPLVGLPTPAPDASEALTIPIVATAKPRRSAIMWLSVFGLIAAVALALFFILRR